MKTTLGIVKKSLKVADRKMSLYLRLKIKLGDKVEVIRVGELYKKLREVIYSL